MDQSSFLAVGGDFNGEVAVRPIKTILRTRLGSGPRALITRF